jgi:hypothetical protein
MASTLAGGAPSSRHRRRDARRQGLRLARAGRGEHQQRRAAVRHHLALLVVQLDLHLHFFVPRTLYIRMDKRIRMQQVTHL